jgi:uncharacterized protein (UPF0548 family)
MVSAVKLTDLTDAPLTYTQVGATGRPDGMPDGFNHVSAVHRIGSGRDCFEAAGAAVLRFGMLRGAGVRVTASTEVAEVGTVVVGRLGPFAAPCRVVYVLDEPHRRGFAYGTLPGHPVAGEERFSVRFDPASESVYAEVAAFSRPRTWWARLGAPALTVVQKLVTQRYLRAL